MIHEKTNKFRSALIDEPAPSLLTRLWPSNGAGGDDLSSNRRQSTPSSMECIRRDLEMLLNTRVLRCDIPAGLHHVRQSIVRYGIEDMAGKPLQNEQHRQDFAYELANTIARFEPRLRNIRVHAVVDVTQQYRFRIDALLAHGAADETVSFESALESTTTRISVSQVEQ